MLQENNKYDLFLRKNKMELKSLTLNLVFIVALCVGVIPNTYGMENTVNIRNYSDVINDLLSEGHRTDDEFEDLALMVLPKIEKFILQQKKQSNIPYIDLCISYLNKCFTLKECSEEQVIQMLKDRFTGNASLASLYLMHRQYVVSQLQLDKLHAMINKNNDMNILTHWLLIFDNTQHAYENLIVKKLTTLIEKQGLKLEMRPWELTLLHAGAHLQGQGKPVIDKLREKEQAQQKIRQDLRAQADKRKDHGVAALFNLLKEGKTAELEVLLEWELLGDDAPLVEYKEYINTQIQERIKKNKFIKNSAETLQLWQDTFSAFTKKELQSKLPECAICCDNKPYLLDCIHCKQSYCQACAENWIGTNFTYTTNYQNQNVNKKSRVCNDSCPYCKQPITAEQLEDMIQRAEKTCGTQGKPTYAAIKEANIQLLNAVATKNQAKIKDLIAEGIANINILADGQDSLLLWAIRKKYTEIIDCLINAGINLNAENESGNTALICVLKNNDISTAHILIQAGADVNNADEYGEAPLVYAVRAGDLKLIKALVNAKADLNICDKDDEPLLRLAVKTNNVAIVQALVDGGSTQKDSALLLAAHMYYNRGSENERNLSIVKLLIKAGADLNTRSKNECTPLILACDKNNTAGAQALIKAGANVNIVDKDGDTALLVAVQKNNTDLVKALVHAKADVSIVNKDGESLLIEAVRKNNAEIVKALVNAKADVNICDKEKELLLKLAVKTNNVEIVQALVDGGSRQKDSALLLAAHTYYSHRSKDECNLSILKLLIKAGADVNTRSKTESTPLILACDKNNTAGAQALIEAGADVNYGNSALLLAVQKNNTDLVKALVHAKADVNICDKDDEPLLRLAVKTNNVAIVQALVDGGSTQKDHALLLAAHMYYNRKSENERNLSIVKLLIKAGADVNTRSDTECTPLILACNKNNTAVAQALIEAGADINLINNDGNSALLLAVQNNNTDLVKALIKVKADVSICDKNDESILRLAVKTNNVEIVQALMDGGSMEKDDALLLAAYTYYDSERKDKCNLSIVKLLINAGADVNTRSEAESTPLILVCHKNNTAGAQVLIEAGADVNLINKDGSSALLVATQKNNTDLVKALLHAKADVSIVNKDGEFLLIEAVRKNNAEIVKALINAKADLNICDKDDESILRLAVKINNVEIVQALVDGGSTEKDDALLLAAYTYYDSERKDKCNLSIVKLLINAGADVNTRSEAENTPLILVCHKNNTAGAQVLIEAGADVNLINKDGSSALLVATQKNNTDLVKALIKAKADVSICDKNDESILRLAVKFNNFAIVQALVDGGSTQKDSALLLAAHTYYSHRSKDECNLSILKLLIKAGADVNTRSKTEGTPLILACDKNNTAGAQALIEAGADVNLVNKGGNSALILAVQKNNTDLFNALLHAKADVSVVNKDGESVLIDAVRKNNPEIVKALINAKVNVNICDKDDESLLRLAVKANDVTIVQALIDGGSTQKDRALLLAAYMYCVYQSEKERNLNILKLLIKAGADVNIRSKTECTPLMLACYKNNIAKAHALIEAGADVNLVNKDGESALFLAVQVKNSDLSNALINAKADISEKYYINLLELATNSNNADMTLKIINPAPKSFVRKKIETLLAIYNKASSCIAELPKEVLKIIISYMHPEYVIDFPTIASLHPCVLVDTIPLETLSLLVKDKKLNRDIIIGAWKEKLNTIAQTLKLSKKLSDAKIQSFKDETLKKIDVYL